MHAIFDEQEERDAKDDDSNFSAESFKRKKRMDNTKTKKGSGIGLGTGKGIDVKPTPLGDIDNVGSRKGSGQLEN